MRLVSIWNEIMKGETIIIKGDRIKAGKQILCLLYPEITKQLDKYVISVAGESGSGKSGIAIVLSRYLSEKGLKCLILQQDDYFIYPPKTNAKIRRKNISHVGMSEVHLDLLDQHIEDILEGKRVLKKPLVLFENDQITEEIVNVEEIQVVIVEGTYTTVLKNVQKRIFIDFDSIDTREARLERGREEQSKFLDRILEIEHDIIITHRKHADIIVTKTYDAKKAK